MKNKPAPSPKSAAAPAAPAPSFSRVDRRNAILNAAARRLSNDPSATWNTFTSKFTDAIYPLRVSDADLTELWVRAKLAVILEDALRNLKLGQRSGPAKDLRQIGVEFPRSERFTKGAGKKK